MSISVNALVLAAEEEGGTSNFLVPDFTFVLEFIAFAVLFYLLAKYIIPPINAAMVRRQEAIRKEFAELDEAKANANAARGRVQAQIADARHEAARIRDEAHDQGTAIIAEAKQQAQVEHDRIVAHTQIEADRQQAVNSLRGEVGSLATTLAGRIVGESLDDDARQSRVMERFLAELETGAAGKGAARRSRCVCRRPHRPHR